MAHQCTGLDLFNRCVCFALLIDPSHGRHADQIFDPGPLKPLGGFGRVNHDNSDRTVSGRSPVLFSAGSKVCPFLAGEILGLARKKYGNFSGHIDSCIIVILQFRGFNTIADKHAVGLQVCALAETGPHKKLLNKDQ